jgi:hypothetical protein
MSVAVPLSVRWLVGEQAHFSVRHAALLLPRWMGAEGPDLSLHKKFIPNKCFPIILATTT